MHRASSDSLTFFSIAALAIVCTVGCENGADTYPVTVKVSYPDGKTLEGAIVAFHHIPELPDEENAKARNAIGKVGVDGTCQLTTYSPGDGAVAGHHRVTVAPPPMSREANIADGAKQRQLIHPRFLRAETSKLEAVVSPDDENKISIQIERR